MPFSNSKWTAVASRLWKTWNDSVGVDPPFQTANGQLFYKQILKDVKWLGFQLVQVILVRLQPGLVFFSVFAARYGWKCLFLLEIRSGLVFWILKAHRYNAQLHPIISMCVVQFSVGKAFSEDVLFFPLTGLWNRQESLRKVDGHWKLGTSTSGIPGKGGFHNV